MKKIKDWIKNFINKYIVAKDPCCKKEGQEYIKNGYVMKEDRKEDFWEKGRIYERNPDTKEIRSRKVGDYGNERIEKSPPSKKKRGRPKKKK